MIPMATTRLFLMGGSIVTGAAALLVAPARWGLHPFHGIVLGCALYAAALRRYAERAEMDALQHPSSREWAAHGARLALRAAAFLGLAAGQAYLCFELQPGADLRAAFVILSSWIVVESVG